MPNVLDITKEQCPMTFVKTTIALNGLQKGEVLEVLVCAGEPLENIPRTIKENGHKILYTEQVNDIVYKLAIEN